MNQQSEIEDLYQLSFDKLYDSLLQSAKSTSGADRILLYLSGGDDNILYQYHTSEYYDKFPSRIKVTDYNFIGKAFQKRTVTISKKQTTPLLEETPYNTAIAVPIINNNLVYAIALALKNNGIFTQEIRNELKTRVKQYAQPLFNVLLTHENANLSSVHKRLNALSTKLLAINEDREEVYRTIAESANELLNADLSLLYGYDKDKDEVLIPPYFCGELSDQTFMLSKGPDHKNSLANRLIKKDSPYFAPLAQEELDYSSIPRNMPNLDIFPIREGIISSAGIPLKAGEDILGVLFINYRSFQLFTSNQRTALELFARLSALALLNCKSIENQSNTTKQLEVLNELSLQLNSATSKDVYKIFQKIHYQTKRLIPADSFYVAYCLDGINIIDFPYAIERGEDIRANAEYSKRKQRFGLSEYVISTNKPLLITEGVEQWLINNEIEIVGEVSESWIGVPLVSEGETLGMLGVQSFDKEVLYNKSHLDILLAISNQVSPLLLRIKRLEELKRNHKEIELLGKATLAISSSDDLEQRLDQIAEAATNLFDAQGGKVYLPDRKRKKLILKAIYSKNEIPTLKKGDEFEFGQGLSGQVYSNDRGFYTNNYKEYPYRLKDHASHFKSIIGVPLKLESNEKSLGIITVFETKGNRKFTVEDLDKINHFAIYAALAIRDAQLKSEQSIQIERLLQINLVIQKISMSNDLKTDLQNTVEIICNQLSCSRCSIFLRGAADDVTYLKRTANYPEKEDDAGLVLERNQGLAWKVMTSGKPQYFNHPSDHEEFHHIPGRRYGFKSLMIVPLNIGDKSIGVITADSEYENFFNHNDLNWVSTLASNIAIVFESNSAAFKREALSKKFFQSLTFRDSHHISGIEGLLKTIVTEAMDTLPGSSATIYLISEDKKFIKHSYWPPKLEKFKPWPRQNPKSGEFTGITSELISTKQFIHIEDVSQDPRVTPLLKDEIHALSAYPLMIQDDVIGAIYFNHEEHRKITPIEQRFMSTLADIAALALNEYMLVNRVAKIRQSAKTITHAAIINDWKSTLDSLVDETMKNLGGDAICLFTYDWENDDFDYPPILRGVEHEKRVFTSTRGVDKNAVNYKFIEKKELLHTYVDVTKEPIFNQKGFVKREKIKSAAIAKLVFQQNNEQIPVGILFINYRSPKQEFTQQERDDIELFAGLAATIIRSAKLYKKLNRIREAARKFAKTTLKAPAQLQDKLNDIVREIKNVFLCDVVSVHVYNTKEKTFEASYASIGEYSEEIAPDLKPSVLLEVLSREDICSTNDPEQATFLLGPFAHRQGIRSVAATPLKGSMGKVGVLFVSYRRQHKFSEEDKKDLKLFGDQSAIAITNTLQYEEILNKTERFEALLSNSPNPIVAADVRGNITYANPKAEEILGYTSKQLEELHTKDLYWDGLAEAFKVNALLKKDTTFRQRVSHIRDSLGNRIPILLTASFLHHSSQNKLKRESIGILEDQRVVMLTGRIKKLFQVIDHLGGKADIDQILEEVFNQAFELYDSTLFGCLFKITDNNLILVKEDFREKTKTKSKKLNRQVPSFKKVITSKQPIFIDSFEELHEKYLPLSKKSKSGLILPLLLNDNCTAILYLESHVAKEFNPDDHILKMLVAQATAALQRAQYYDIRTRWRNAQENMFTSSQAIVAAQISTSMLHEVKNMLAAISHKITIVRESIEQSQNSLDENVLTNLLDSVGASIHDSYLLAVKSQKFKASLSTEFEPCYLNDIIRDALAQLESTSQTKKINMIPNLEPKLGSENVQEHLQVGMDKGLIFFVIMNLVLNAIEASSPGSAITIESSIKKSNIFFKVKDRGMGIDPAIQAKIFNPFFSKYKDQGVGLGLFLCKYIIVELHAGEIDFKSEKGKTSFFVYLPITAKNSS